MAGAETRLAVYGTLAPGRPNHHQLAGLDGRWIPGTVNGTLDPRGWGASMGYPGIKLDSSGPTVQVQVLESPDLPDHWAMLDAFEGGSYRRVITQVITSEGEIQAQIYEIADTTDSVARPA